MTKIDWIAVDWDTARLHIWAMHGDTIVAKARSDKGTANLTSSEFEPALLEVITPYLGQDVMPVVCCGMVGSPQGWGEAPYQTVPCAPISDAVMTRVLGTDPRISVSIVPGIKQTNPPDVMHGEETQIAGYLHANPDFDGVICLAGFHTKWVHISAGEIVSFRSCMAGEMLTLLSEYSVLKHSVKSDAFDADAFAEAVSDSMTRPADLTAKMFQLRAASLVSKLAAGTARARLSGLLIGAELAATKPYWLGQQVAVIGSNSLGKLYAKALADQGVQTHVSDVTDWALSGLIAAHTAQKDTD